MLQELCTMPTAMQLVHCMATEEHNYTKCEVGHWGMYIDPQVCKAR